MHQLDLMDLIEEKYNELRAEVDKWAGKRNWAWEDQDDIFQNCIVYILENGIPPTGWSKVVSKMVGKARQRRYREKKRYKSPYKLNDDTNDYDYDDGEKYIARIDNTPSSIMTDEPDEYHGEKDIWRTTYPSQGRK